MTADNKFFPGISIAEEGECDCLGRLRNGQQFFLSNQRNLDPLERPSHKQNNQAKNPNDTSTGTYNKRSLRKVREPICRSPQQKVETCIRHEYYSPGGTSPSNERRENRLKQYKEVEYNHERPKIQFDFSSSKQQLRINQQSTLARISSCQNLQSGHQVLSNVGHIAIPSTTHPPLQQPLSPRVGFRYDYHDFLPMTPRLKAEGVSNQIIEFKTQVKGEPYSLKDLPTVEYLNLKGLRANVAEQLKSERSIRSARSKLSEGVELNTNQLFVPKKQQPLNSVKIIKNTVQSVIQHDTLRSKIEFNEKRKHLEPGWTKIDPKKSEIQGIGRSRIGGKKAKPGKTALKRINDVDQICSVMDSEEASHESDKESVVLGRLREYGSVVEPSAAMNTPSTQSKVGYQSTTAQKSFLRAFESSHFR